MQPQITIRNCPSQLAIFIRDRRVRIVGLDGCDGAGKTRLAQRLAQITKGHVIDLDWHLNKDQGHFVKAIRLEELKAAIEKAIGKGDLILISGICLKAVLSKIDIEPDFTVYVEKRSPNSNLPCELDILDCEENGNISSLDDDCFTDLHREIGQYHSDFKPKSSADVVFLTLEEFEELA